MSITTDFYAWLSRRGNEQRQLIHESGRLTVGLFSAKIARKRLREATKYSEGYGRVYRWDTWKWLIRTHWIAGKQIDLIESCFLKIDQAKRLQLRGTERKQFLACFATSSDKFRKFKTLIKVLEANKKKWLKTQERIEEVRPPIFFTHVFLRLRSSSGIEITSLLIGGLIALGAVHMVFFYEAAVGTSAYSYWTLEDLIVRGIVVFPYVVIILAAIETLFYFSRRIVLRKLRYLLYGWILRRPVAPVLVLFALMTLVVSILGYARGSSAFDQFAEMNEHTAEMATVLDKSVLENVHLVGTSDRTAIFLRADLKGMDYKRWRNKVIKPEIGYFMTAYRITLSFLGLRGNQPEPDEAEKKYTVLVMDRALIVCHAKMGKC